MTDRTSPRRLAAALFTVALAGLAPPAVAETVPQGREIHIFVKKNPDPHIHKVLPNAKGVCRGAKGGNKKDDCEEAVTWVLKGALQTGWKVEVRLKEGVAPYCFKKDVYTLTNIDVPVPSEDIEPDPNVCKRWHVWPYDVVLLDADGKEQGREDPLVVINY